MVSSCGCNPGLVVWFLKQALVNIAKDTGHPLETEPQTQEEWACLMRDLDVKGVHIAERDTQVTNLVRKPDEFWNTWSVEGMLEEGLRQPSEVGWGTCEDKIPSDGLEHKMGSKCGIYLKDPGMKKRVKSWCPTLGPQ